MLQLVQLLWIDFSSVFPASTGTTLIVSSLRRIWSVIEVCEVVPCSTYWHKWLPNLTCVLPAQQPCSILASVFTKQALQEPSPKNRKELSRNQWNIKYQERLGRLSSQLRGSLYWAGRVTKTGGWRCFSSSTGPEKGSITCMFITNGIRRIPTGDRRRPVLKSTLSISRKTPPFNWLSIQDINMLDSSNSSNSFNLLQFKTFC